MGIACGDANGDGLLDLFVTNFHAESNTLYKQESADDFRDISHPFGLQEPSMSMVGFGTQFVDANLDGHQDLIVANGHIDKFDAGGIAYQMPPQCFLNKGNGTFEAADPKRLGAYFQGKYLGRALARLDWNLDGRDDVIVTHLDAPVALLTNVTREHGNYLSLQLFGVASSRNPIGATVALHTDGRIQTKQLTAGDGYLASNERILTFGLGTSTTIQRVTVAWPSGLKQEFTGPKVNSRVVAVEGARLLFPSSDSSSR